MFKILNAIKMIKSAKSDWKTTSLGVVSALLSLLVIFSDLIDREQANALESIAANLVDNAEVVYGLIIAAIGIISRDGDRTKEDKK